ncbi:MAG: glycoside hydrolase family 3 domain protein, partial [Paenibacillus sp.]|nr:glycoside hydrolase family 3 domain protein [Paenibacillus sp.]
DASTGNATTSLTKFDVSHNGAAGIVRIAEAYHSLAIGQAPPIDSDKTALTQAIASAQQQHAKAAEGDKLGKYKVGAKAELQAAIAAATSVQGNAWATQGQVDAATGALNAAVQHFQSRFISLVDGQSQITIRDLSIIAKYFGATSEDANWSEIGMADLLGDGEINIRVLAAVAQMILTGWSMEE